VTLGSFGAILGEVSLSAAIVAGFVRSSCTAQSFVLILATLHWEMADLAACRTCRISFWAILDCMVN
jgi:hypothetical protein